MTNTYPLVSIVIPTFNQRPDFLRETLRSALAQTYPNFEVVLSENHSTNGADKVLEEFTDKRLRIVSPEQHLAMVPHFEFAGRQAKGEFISFLCSDDLVTPDWLAELVPLLASDKSAVFGFGEIANVKHDHPEEFLYRCRNDKLPTGSYSVKDMLKLILPFNRASSWLVGDLIRTDAYLRAGGMGQPNIRYCGDYALALRLLEQGGAVYLNKLVGLHRRWEANDGKTDSKRTLAAIDDTAELFRIIDTSAALGAQISALQSELASSKRSKATVSALLVLEAVATGEINAKDLAAPSAKILAMDNSIAIRAILGCARVPAIASLVRIFHKSAKSMYRVLVAPRMNRSGAATSKQQ